MLVNVGNHMLIPSGSILAAIFCKVLMCSAQPAWDTQEKVISLFCICPQCSQCSKTEKQVSKANNDQGSPHSPGVSAGK